MKKGKKKHQKLSTVGLSCDVNVSSQRVKLLLGISPAVWPPSDGKQRNKLEWPNCPYLSIHPYSCMLGHKMYATIH